MSQLMHIQLFATRIHIAASIRTMCKALYYTDLPHTLHLVRYVLGIIISLLAFDFELSTLQRDSRLLLLFPILWFRSLGIPIALQ